MPYPDPERPARPAFTNNPAPLTDLPSLFFLLWENIWLLALCLAAALLVAAYYYRTAPRIYRASTIVQVEQEPERVLKVEQIVKEDLRGLEVMNTIVETLRSRPLLERVLDTNNLAQDPEFVARKEGENPPTREDLVGRLEGMVQTSLRRNTRLIDITVSHRSPRLAALIANSVSDTYLSQDFEMQTSSTKGASAFLKEESDRLKQKLEVSEKALNDYRQNVGSISLEQSQDIIIPQMRELSARVTQAKADLIRLQSENEQILRCQSNVWGLLDLSIVTADPNVALARSILAQAESDFALIGQRYREKNPKYVQAFNKVEVSRQSLSNSVLRAAAAVRTAGEDARVIDLGLSKFMHESEQAALKLSEQAIGFNMLARDVESDRALFESVLNRLKETSLTTDLQLDKIHVVQAATEPTLPSSPNLVRTFGLGVMGGGLLGFVLVFGFKAFDTSFKSLDDAEQTLGLSVLCAIPKLKEVRGSATEVVVTDGDAHSAGMEAFRTLRASVSMLGPEDERRSFMFTSALPGEGKSFTSVNYALSLAQQGLRVLLIDADLRRPSVAQVLTGEAHHEWAGVTDYLTGRKSLAEIVRSEPAHVNLSWIPSGQVAPNSAELLAQGRLHKLFEEALQRYDRLVIDTAPVLAVSDALVIAKEVQTSILVVRGGKSPRAPVARSVQLLKAAGATLGGVVLNLVQHRRGGGYDYYGSGYYYKYGYRDGASRKSSKRASKTPAKPDSVTKPEA